MKKVMTFLACQDFVRVMVKNLQKIVSKITLVTLGLGSGGGGIGCGEDIRLHRCSMGTILYRISLLFFLLFCQFLLLSFLVNDAVCLITDVGH